MAKTEHHADERRAIPGDGLLHVAPLVGIAVLVVNDHWLKGACGSWWTGKLSDVAGLVFFPLFLQAVWEVILATLRLRWGPSRRVLAWAAGATVTMFCLVQLWAPASWLYRHGLGHIQWPLRAGWSLMTGASTPPVAPVQLTADPTDCLAAPAVLLALWAGWHRHWQTDRHPE